MAIQFPLFPQGSSTEISLISSSVDLKPYMGGPQQRYSRLGDRWRLKVEMRKMHAAQAGPILATLVQGVGSKLLVPVHQPGLDTSVWSDGQVAQAVSGGRVVKHNGGGAAKQVGQFVSIIVNGVRFLHQITLVSGQDLTLYPMLKKPLIGGEVMEFGLPKIEGFSSGNEQGWTIGLALSVGVSFEIVEAQ